MADDKDAIIKELLDIADRLAYLATHHGNPPYSVGTQTARLDEIKERLMGEDDDPRT